MYSNLGRIDQKYPANDSKLLGFKLSFYIRT